MVKKQKNRDRKSPYNLVPTTKPHNLSYTRLLEKAVTGEDYEKAAGLRNKINGVKKRISNHDNEFIRYAGEYMVLNSMPSTAEFRLINRGLTTDWGAEGKEIVTGKDALNLIHASGDVFNSFIAPHKTALKAVLGFIHNQQYILRFDRTKTAVHFKGDVRKDFAYGGPITIDK